ncbi:MAG: four-helix bundle copper-binding protein, partial [Chitinophagaceae bacterium]
MEHQQPSHHHSGHKHEALIQTLLDCARACEMCAAACLDEDNVTPMAHCIELDRDCAEICYLGAKLLLRD